MKTCLVLEGGALRGIYTAGVLDSLQKENVKIDAIIGVSMGSLVGINYLSNQPGRALRYNLKYCQNKDYMGFLPLLKTGDIVNKEFAYYDLPNKLDYFDNETYRKSKIKFYCTVTNIETGKAEYKEIKDAKKDTEYLRAGGSIPGVSKIVKIKNKKYLDGGIADAIPLQKAIDMGYEKIILVLTRPMEYRKPERKINFLARRYHHYPNFERAIRTRSQRYNKTIEKILELEKEKKIFVIRPSKKVSIKPIEHNPKRIEEQYNLGVTDFESQKESLKKYLSKQNRKEKYEL